MTRYLEIKNRVIIKIDPQGQMQFIYDDELRPLMDLGETSIKRASHVEPTPENTWIVDLSPLGGEWADKKLGPFLDREVALFEETEWIKENILGAKPIRRYLCQHCGGMGKLEAGRRWDGKVYCEQPAGICDFCRGVGYLGPIKPS